MKTKTLIFIIVLILGGFVAGQFIHLPHLLHRVDSDSPVKEAADKVLYWTCGMHPQIMEDGPGTCPICGMNLTPYKESSGGDGSSGAEGKEKILYWVAPMDPSYVRDEPGKSPMGMDLVPVYENDVVGGSSISIDPAVVQNMGVRTAVVKRDSISRMVRTVGHVDYDETRLAVINTKISGWIEKVHVQETGAFVEKGHPLYDIYSPELVAAQEEYLLSFDSGSSRIREASRKRLKFWDIPESEIQTLERTRKVRKTLTFAAPISGHLTHLNAVEGKFFNKGADLFRIADLSTVWVYAHIYENEAPFVQEGLRVSMELSYLPGKEYEGVVDYVYPFMDQKTRDIKVRIVFPNSDLELKPQMYANVKMETEVSDDSLLIPTESIVHSGERTVVFVVKDAGKFQPREVKTGVEDDKGRTQILSGVAKGETVVTSGQFLLDSESKLREAIAKMMSKDQDVSSKPEEDHSVHDMDNSTPKDEHDQGDQTSKWPDPSKGAYVCPMESDNYYSDEPGKCPICGMTLVESEELYKEIHGTINHDSHSDDMNEELPQESVWPDAAKGKYVCPMEDDNYYSDEPGKCPVCGMELVDTQELHDEVHGGHDH